MGVGIVRSVAVGVLNRISIGVPSVAVGRGVCHLVEETELAVAVTLTVAVLVV